MTTFNQIENLLNSKLDVFGQNEYRDLISFINDLKQVVENIERERHHCITYNSLDQFDSRLIKILPSFNDEEKYEELKAKLKSYCEIKGFIHDDLLKEQLLKFPVHHESNLYFEFKFIIRPGHLDNDEGIELYEFHQTLFHYFKLRLIYILKKEVSFELHEYPNAIFKSPKIYSQFLDYIDVIQTDDYPSLSFLYQNLLFHKLIHYTKQIKFSQWLLEKNIISKTTFELIQDKGGFSSLKKSSSKARVPPFTKAFKIN